MSFENDKNKTLIKSINHSETMRRERERKKRYEQNYGLEKKTY